MNSSRANEIDKLVKQIKPLLNDFGGLSSSEMTELGGLFSRWMKLSNERTIDLKKEVDENTESVKILVERINESETTVAMMEAFLLENELYEKFISFSDEVIQDFFKKQKPNLILVQ